MASAYRALMGDDPQTAASLVVGLRYSVIRYLDTVTGRTFLLLAERRRATGTWDHAWGLYLFAPDASTALTIEVPHPVYDIDTDALGVELFLQADASALFVAGAHRDANADGSADVAHRSGSVFEAVHRAALGSAGSVVQIHGFNSADHEDGDVTVSSGQTTPVAPATDVATALELGGYRVCLYDGVSCTGLGGTTNVQGVSARAFGVPFVHLELALGLRDTPGVRASVAALLVPPLS